MNFEPIEARVTGPSGTTTTWCYRHWGKKEVWILGDLRGRLLRQRLREAGFDKRQARRFIRRFGGA